MLSGYGVSNRARFSQLSLILAASAIVNHCALTYAGTVALPRNWTVSNPNFTDAQMGNIFTFVPGDVPADGSNTAIPIKVTLSFADFSPKAFLFTNSFAKDVYTAAPHNGDVDASINSYSRFSANFMLTNGSPATDWTGFIFDIKDNVAGRTLDGTDSHPITAHFHASNTSAFATSLAPFNNLDRFPAPSDGAKFNGFGIATVSAGGVITPTNTWSPTGLGLHNNISFTNANANQTSFTLTLQPVPEPASVILFALGGFALWRSRAIVRRAR